MRLSMDSPVVGYYLAQGGNNSMKTVGDIMEAEQYGLAVKKGNDKLAGRNQQGFG